MTFTPRVDHCKSCDMPIYWAVSANGKRMPVDVEPSASGNVVLTVSKLGDLKAVVLARDTEQVKGRNYYTSHFATCKDAAYHRRKKNA